MTDPTDLAADADVIIDIDLLFWAPTFQLQVLPFLRGLARRRPMAVVWPGSINGTTARYSEPGRKDFYEAELEDAIVLRTVHNHFGDEPSYTMETVGA